MAKRNPVGRPRKEGDRYPGGKLKGDAMVADVRKSQAPMLWRRALDNVVTLARNPQIGSEIGRLSMHGILSDGEAATADYIGETIGRDERLSGSPKRSAASPAFMRGYGKADDPYSGRDDRARVRFERQARRARKAAERVFTSIREAVQNDPIAYTRAHGTIYDLCVNDTVIPQGLHADVAAMLRAIGRKIGIITGLELKRDSGGPKPGDAAHIGGSLVDALAAKAEQERITVTGWSIDPDAPAKQRGLIVEGHDADGEVKTLRLRIDRNHAAPSVLDAEITKAAAGKWGAL